jgi:DNA-binding NtrC family response regulator
MRASILIVEGEKAIRELLARCLADDGYRVLTASSGEEAHSCIEQEELDALIADVTAPGIGALDIVHRAGWLNPRASLILMAADPTVERAVKAVFDGAAEFLSKPIRLDDLRARLNQLVLGRSGPHPPHVPGRAGAAAPEETIVGKSAAIRSLRERIAQIAATPSNVLITGETGTGKELVAQAIHIASARRAHRFVVVNCGAIPESLFESQFFGHSRGAFTGAVCATPGLVVLANRGTFYLDEIGELSVQLQVKLLRVIEQKEVWPIGATAPVRVDTRIVASTHRDLFREMEFGGFRADLFYRLHVVHLALPPLRDRREDIPLLVDHFIPRLNCKLSRTVLGIHPDALSVLVEREWRGNVRELESVVESAMISSAGETIGFDDLPASLRTTRARDAASLKAVTQRFERQQILGVLAETHFDKREAARRLGIGLASLYRKLDGQSPSGSRFSSRK